MFCLAMVTSRDQLEEGTAGRGSAGTKTMRWHQARDVRRTSGRARERVPQRERERVSDGVGTDGESSRHGFGILFGLCGKLLGSSAQGSDMMGIVRS